jgi:hypothetical protein
MAKEIMKCPLCGSSVVKMKNFNTDEYWYKCTGYKDKGCHFALNEGYTSAEIYLQGEKLEARCMGCGEPLSIACGPYGLYARCYECNYDLEPHEINGETIERWANNRSPKVRNEIKELRLEFKKELKEDKNYGFDEEFKDCNVSTKGNTNVDKSLEKESGDDSEIEATTISQFYGNISHFDKVAYNLPSEGPFRKLVYRMKLKEAKKVGRCCLYYVSDLQQALRKFKFQRVEHKHDFSVNDSDILEKWKKTQWAEEVWNYDQLEYWLSLKFGHLTHFEEGLPLLSLYELTIGYILRWVNYDHEGLVKIILNKDILKRYCNLCSGTSWSDELEFEPRDFAYAFSQKDKYESNIIWETLDDYLDIGPFINSFSEEDKSNVIDYLISKDIKVRLNSLSYCSFYISKELAEACKSEIDKLKNATFQNVKKDTEKPTKAAIQPMIVQQVTDLLSGKINPEDKNEKWGRDQIMETLKSYYGNGSLSYTGYVEGALNTMRIRKQLKIVGYYIRPGNHRVNLLYQLSDSPFKEEKVAKLTARLSSAANFYKTHPLTLEGRCFFEEEILPNLKSHLTKCSTTYSVTYSKKHLIEAYKNLPNEYKLEEVKENTPQIVTTDIQVDSSAPSAEPLIDEPVVSRQVSLLSKVKNFFNKKSSKLDSEFIEF